MISAKSVMRQRVWLMPAAWVLLHVAVPDRIERDHAHVVLEFLGERIGQPSEAAHLARF
jgi:hypothetical protein